MAVRAHPRGLESRVRALRPFGCSLRSDAETPEAGAGLASSPNSQTWVALDPKFGVLLTQQHPGTWANIEIDDETVDEVNLLTYAWAADAIYGPSQEAVTRVRRVAKQKRTLLGEFRYRPPRVWVAQGGADGGGPHDFTSRFKSHTVTRKLYVSEEGRRGGGSPRSRPGRRRARRVL
jgi:hypothetical protein